MATIPMNNRYTRQYPGFRVQMAGTEVELELYGEIVPEQPRSWWTDEPIEGNWIIQGDVLRELDSAVKAGAKSIRLRINSLGGDAGVAITIHNRLREYSSEKGLKVRCVIDGIAASGGSLIACACDEVEVFSSSLFMVHKCWGYMFGGYNADELRAEARKRDAWDQAQINIYRDKCGLSDTVISHMMSDTTYLTGQEIVEKGFADKLSSGGKAKVAASADRNCLFVNGVRMHLAPGMLVPNGIPIESGDEAAQQLQSPVASRQSSAAQRIAAALSEVVGYPVHVTPCNADATVFDVEGGIKVTEDQFRRLLENGLGDADLFGIVGEADRQPQAAVGAPCEHGDHNTGNGNGTENGNGSRSEEQGSRSEEHSAFRIPHSAFNTLSPGEQPEDINNDMPGGTGEEGGQKTMARNLEELRRENPELAAQVEADVRAGLPAETDVNAAVEAERNRIREIDEIAGLYTAATVTEAKYGTPCTAQEMAFRAAQQAAKTGSSLMAAVMADAKGEGGANAVKAADAQPDSAVKKTGEQKQAEADNAVHALLHKEEESK